MLVLIKIYDGGSNNGYDEQEEEEKKKPQGTEEGDTI